MPNRVKTFFAEAIGYVIYVILVAFYFLGNVWTYVVNHKYSKYWMAHIIIALAASGVMLWIGSKNGMYSPLLAFFGCLIYLGRETVQVQYEPKFDWKGLLAPVIACTLLFMILK